MAFKFEYKNEQELELAYKRLIPGEVKFMVKSISDTDKQGYNLINSKGNPYLKVELVIIDSAGNKGLITDNISSNASWKIHDLCTAVGRADLYNASGELDFTKLIGLQGAAIIEDRSYAKNDGTQATVSSINTYLASNVASAPVAQPKATEPYDDPLPF